VKDETIRIQLLESVTTYEQLAESIEKQQVDAAQYRAEARRIRRAAATGKDAAIGRQILEIATTYEQLAESIEKQR
jgi:hypothetical protein